MVLGSALAEFRRYKQLADRALAQIDEDAFFATPGPETNSIAIVVKHMAGNLRSRWTDFLTTDGEKPDRDRDSEFVLGPDDTRDSLMARWERGWSILFDTLESLTETDLERTVYVRSEPATAAAAILRQLAHAAYHAGQIVLLARHYAGENWTTLTIPRGGSAAYNERMLREQQAPSGSEDEVRA